MPLAPAEDPPDVVTSAGRIVEGLRRDIVEGRMTDGAWIKIPEVARRFGVSGQPVREALQMLQGEGLVQMLPNRGARVRGVDRDRLRQLYELREAIEGFLTGRFAEEAALSDLRRLEAAQAEHDAAIAALDLDRIFRTNEAFHLVMFRHSRNDEALAAWKRSFALTDTLRRRYGNRTGGWDRVRQDHHDMLDACRRRDRTAAMAVAGRHVRDTYEDLVARIEEAEGRT